jgi:hypothetical protein
MSMFILKTGIIRNRVCDPRVPLKLKDKFYRIMI